MTLLDDTLTAITGLERVALADAAERNDRLTKPRGALGALESAGIKLAGIAGECPPPMPWPAAVAVFAADHGVHAEGVSPWPQEVTAQMVFNFLDGGAAVNVFAGHVGADVLVVDVGIATPVEPGLGLVQLAVRRGTGNIALEPAMTTDQARRTIEVGITVAHRLIDDGVRCLLTGDMGIANTTASAALIAVFTGREAAAVTGRGTGIDDATYALKIDVVRRALALHSPVPSAPLDVLAAVGGLEHAAIAGLILAAAARRVPVVLDGVIAGSAALVAQALAPASIDFCFAGHRSTEPGHAVALAKLGLEPFIDLGLRLGEGTGAVLALPVLQCAARALREMATFDSAGVVEKAR
jgi:nicotinate-nucleotide--dimethylbenzimidazole phosphoribosyltransferase